MGISAEEREIVGEILELNERGTTDMLPSTMRNPVSNYTDPEQLRREIDVLFRQFPIVVAHASEISEVGDFVTHDDTGVAMLITRGEDGGARAFLNVCRHRGARLASEPCGRARRITCPYHSWTYDLDGRLRGIPQSVGFDGVDRDELGLVELPAFERFGLIWVVPTPGEPAPGKAIDIDRWLAPFDEQFAGLDLGSHVVFEKWALHRNMSWRLALEGFQESYHFCSAHRDTACSNYLDNQSVFRHYDPHFRHAVPLPRTLELRDVPENEWDYRRNFMTQNYVFPANFVQSMTDHVYVHTILPTGPGTCAFHCTMLIPEAPSNDKAERYWRRNYEVVRAVFDEDFAIGEGIQRNFAMGANDHFTFGRFENGLHFGQQAIDDALAGRISVPTM